MVRTYAWNASVQSNIPFDDAKTYSETVSESTVDSGIDCPASYVRPDKDIHDLLSKSAPVNRPTIEKGATLYGVHTVHIEGQTYFQPFDCAMHQFINSQYSAAHDNRPYIAHNYLPLVNERSANFPVSVQAEHLAMLAAIQSAARSPSHSAERPRKETFSESWKKAEEEEGNDPLNESFKSGHNSLPDFAYKNKICVPPTETARRVSHPEFGSFAAEKKTDGSMIDELPWARGNPQPKTGVRGKAAWYVNDGYLNTSFARERLGQPQTFDVPLPPLSRFSGGNDRSWSNVLGSHISNGISRVLPRNLYDDSSPKNIYNFNQKELGSTHVDVPKPTYYGYPSSQSYDSFSHSIGLPTLEPSAVGDRLPNISGPMLNHSFNSNPAKAEKERHKMELLQQIEENRRRKEMEKMKEWEEDEKRRIQDELYNERQRRLMDEEQRREREKAAAAERKAEQLAFQAASAARASRPRRRTPVPSTPPPPRQRKARTPSPEEQEPDREPFVTHEEFRTNSPPVPTLRNKMAEMSFNDSESLPKINGNSRSISRTSVLRK